MLNKYIEGLIKQDRVEKVWEGGNVDATEAGMANAEDSKLKALKDSPMLNCAQNARWRAN